jgi:hypothetical protein
LDPAEQVLPDDGDKIKYLKRCVFKYKEDDILDKVETMDDVQERNNGTKCTVADT